MPWVNGKWVTELSPAIMAQPDVFGITQAQVQAQQAGQSLAQAPPTVARVPTTGYPSRAGGGYFETPVPMAPAEPGGIAYTQTIGAPTNTTVPSVNYEQIAQLITFLILYIYLSRTG